MIGQGLSKCHAFVHSVDNRIQRLLSRANCAHAVMDTTRAKAALRNLKATALSQEHIPNRHSNIVENDLGMVVDVPEQSQRTDDVHSFGITWHQDHRMLLMCGITPRSPQEDEDFTLRSARTTNVPFVSIDYVLITISLNGRTDVRGITAGNAWLSHGIGTSNGACKQWLKPLLFLLFRPILFQNFHVAGVRSCAVHGHVAEPEGSQNLTDRCVLQHSKLPNFRQKEVVQASLLRLLPQACRDGWRGCPNRMICVGSIFMRRCRLAIF
mmetsp:Transcript_65090/g.152361  ORF Transcript_65090/g.152361 Transcript_65090/m.152361 type:complete len:268 (-) Transcript_65090:278-1081(-)